MGSRGAFVNVNTKDFTFVDDGQTYHSIGEVDGVKVLVRDKGSVKAPDYSHKDTVRTRRTGKPPGCPP